VVPDVENGTREGSAMTDAAKEVEALLDQHGFELVRAKKHKVYRDRYGRTVVQSSTPSDVNAAQNQLKDIRRALRDPEPDTTVDATLSKVQKKSGGGAGAGNLGFDIYEGFAPRSISATPEAKLTELRGHLAARRSYEFKSALTREFSRILQSAEEDGFRSLESCVKEFPTLLRGVNYVMTRGVRRQQDIPPEIIPPHLDVAFIVIWHYLRINMNHQIADVREELREKGSYDPTSLIRDIRRDITEDYRLFYSNESRDRRRRSRIRLMAIARKAANQLLRGASRDQLSELFRREQKNLPSISMVTQSIFDEIETLAVALI
jgi:predicted RNA binding protein YcfA (HicA-like mRNA interferase family)